VFTVQRIAYGGDQSASNYDPVLSGYWWIIIPTLWVYYYLLLGVARAIMKLIAKHITAMGPDLGDGGIRTIFGAVPKRRF
jgi:hypothetical protein